MSIGIGIGISHHLHRGGGGIIPPAITPMALGQNLSFSAYYYYNHALVDIAHGEDIYQVGNGGIAVPYTNYDSSNEVASIPVGATAVQRWLDAPEVDEPYKLTWNGNIGTITLFGASSVGTQNANDITFTPRDIADVKAASAGAQFQYTMPGSGYPTNFQCRPVTDPGGTVAATFSTKLALLSSSSGGPIRFLHPSSVEQNLHVTNAATIKFPQDGDGQLTESVLTAASRNTPSSANWWNRRDGMPHETMIAICTATGRDAWVCANWNYDGTNSLGVFSGSTYLNAIAALWATFAQSTGHKVYIECANEVWNSGTYTVGSQCFNEATALGITMSQRYAQKAVQMFAAFETAFNALGIGPSAGASSKLVRVLAWQNGNSGTPSTFSGMLAFTGVSGHVDALSTAWYYNSVGFALGYTGATAPVIASMYGNVDSQLDSAVASKAIADANGLKFIGYEGGRGDTFTDATFLAALEIDAGGYQVQAYWLNEIRRRIGLNAVICYHDFCDPLNAGSAGSFGILHTITDTINTLPKATSIVDALAGHYTLLDARPGTLTVYANDADGTAIGSPLAGLLPEATYATDDANFSIDTAGQLHAVGSSRTTGGHTFNVIQTPKAGVTVLNGPTKSTSITVTVLPAIPKDNFNDNLLDPMWAVDTQLLGAHGISNAGINVLEQNQRIEFAGSASGQNGLHLTSTVDLTLLAAHFLKIVQLTGTSYEAYPLMYGLLNTGSGGAIVRFRVAAGSNILFFDHYDAAGSFTNIGNFGASSFDATNFPWLRLRYDPGTDKFFADRAASTANNPPLSSEWVQVGSGQTRPADIPTTGYVGVALAPGGAAATLYIDGFNEAT